MSKRVFLLGVGMLLVGVAFVVTDAALGPRPGATEANVRRIRRGMTLEQVEAIFGKPGRPVGGIGGIRSFDKFYEWPGPAGAATVVIRTSWGSPPTVSSATFERTQPSP